MKPPVVEIRYRRPPGRMQVFHQPLLHRGNDCIVTFLPASPLDRPLRVGQDVILEDGAPAIWFTFPDIPHDIGRFHLADGTFTGIYANIITPVQFITPLIWETTDLLLDLWLARDGTRLLLDEDELEEAWQRGWLSDTEVAGARREAERLLALVQQGRWPPPVVHEWTLKRVLAEAAHNSVGGTTPHGLV